jgi:hypothetical protein
MDNDPEAGCLGAMRFSRQSLSFAAAMLAAVLLFGWFAWSRRTEPQSGGASRHGSTGRETSRAAAGSDERNPETSERLDPNLARPAAGTGEAYLAHSFRSFVVAQQGQLGLSPGEVERLVSDLLEFYEIQSEVTARFMQQTAADASSVTVHVPPFPVEGKGVRDLLSERLRKDFPQQYERIMAETGAFVDDAFRGFGITDQTIVVKKTEMPETFEVTWTATVLEGQTPSRDPEGTTYGGSSGVMLMARDQIVSGEFRFLAPLLDRQFPVAGGRH